MYYPEGMKARVSPVQSIEPHRILAPTRDSNQEPLGPVQSSNHYTTAAHNTGIKINVRTLTIVRGIVVI